MTKDQYIDRAPNTDKPGHLEGIDTIELPRENDGPGRPKVIFPEKHLETLRAVAGLGSKKTVANLFGISKLTFERIMERQPEVEKAYLQGRGQKGISLSHKLREEALDGDTTAAIYILKSHFEMYDRPSDTKQKVELSGPEGQPIQFESRINDGRQQLIEALMDAGKINDGRTRNALRGEVIEIEAEVIEEGGDDGAGTQTDDQSA